MPRFNPESDRRIDSYFAEKRGREQKDSESHKLEELYQKALECLEDEGKIEPENFTQFDPAMIKDDEEYVEKMEEKFEAEATPEDRQTKKLATILEAVMHDQIELNDWLGPDVRTRKASRFDDIKNGIDSIAEFHQDNGVKHLAMAIDVTYSSRLLWKKLERIKSDIDRGELSQVRYFESSDGTFKGSLSQVPKVVIGIEKQEIISLAELWGKRKNRELAEHGVQLKILNEIKMQLEAFVEYARRKDQQQIVEIYQRQLRIVESILALPKKTKLVAAANENSSLGDDRVFKAIKDGLAKFNV